MLSDRTMEKRRLQLAFLMPMVTAFFIFLPFLVVGGGFFTYCGDFNSQQIPFWMYSSDYIRTGGGSFTWQTDLGGSFINAYSFYTLGSPFFWLSLLIPADWLPWCMVPLLMLKFAVGGLGAYLFLRRYVTDRRWALLAAMLYCFSGWGIYDIFFNHFIDCMALFPWLIWSMDEFIYEKRRGLFAVFVALNLLCNYFFFLGQVVFCVLYFFVKVLCDEYKVSFKEFFLLAFEAVLGVMLGCMLILPGAHSLLQNPRTTKYASGYNLLLYGKVQQYFAILVSAFLPPDPPYLPNLFKDCTIKWTSMSAYLPLFGATGTIAYLRSRKKTALKRLLPVCLVMALVPILNSSFYAFNSSYYARWYYMPILLMALCTAQALEDADIDMMLGIRPTVWVLGAVAVFGLIPVEKDDVWRIGLPEEASQFWGIWVFAALGVLAVWLILRRAPADRLCWRMLTGVMAFSVLFGVVHIAMGKFPQYERDMAYKTICYDIKDEVEFPDEVFARADSYDCYENLSLFYNIPHLRCFNSTVSPNILKFFPSVGVKRDVSTKPEADQYALRALLSVGYTFTPEESRAEYEAEVAGKGFAYSYSTAGLAVYENENFIPMGFAYDRYVLAEDADKVSASQLPHLMVRALLLTEEQAAAYGGGMERLEAGRLMAADYPTFTQDCAARRAMCCDSFTATRTGFEATITLEEGNLVFFSIPFEEGYSATVNGLPADVVEVNNGLTAVFVPEGGESEIVLTLEPVWLAEAKLITAAGAVLYAGYMLYWRRQKKAAL